MALLKRTFGSSIGKKCVMAITGGLLFIFVILHLLGNLQIFLGAEQLNAYGAFLQSQIEILWASRLGLLLLVVLHIYVSIKLTIENRRARPVPYQQYEAVAASYASRTMFMSGLIILAFIIYHLLHFTVQYPAVNLTGQNFGDLQDGQSRHDVYRMMIVGFSNPWVSGFYILGMALLALHLSHGLGSMFQSLGWKNKTYGSVLDKAAIVIAWIVFLGYSSIPVAILFGYGKEAALP